MPYVLMLALCGMPVFFMEISFGQFASLGPLAIWEVNPLFKGKDSTYILICHHVIMCISKGYSHSLVKTQFKNAV